MMVGIRVVWVFSENVKEGLRLGRLLSLCLRKYRWNEEIILLFKLVS